MLISEVQSDQQDLLDDFDNAEAPPHYDECGGDCPGHCPICSDFHDYCQGHSPFEWIRAAVDFRAKQNNPLSLLHIDADCQAIEFYRHGMPNSVIIGHMVRHRLRMDFGFLTWQVAFELDNKPHYLNTHSVHDAIRYVEAIGELYGQTHS